MGEAMGGEEEEEVGDGGGGGGRWGASNTRPLPLAFGGGGGVGRRIRPLLEHARLSDTRPLPPSAVSSPPISCVRTRITPAADLGGMV